MMWKLYHYLTGAHYIALRYAFDDEVLRVRFDLNGRPYVKIYGDFIWLRTTKERWEALTFDKEGWLQAGAGRDGKHLRVVA